MKPLEQIVRENELAGITFWSEKFIDVMGQMRPQAIYKKVVEMQGREQTQETKEILEAIKEETFDTVMYPFHRSTLIRTGLATEEEIANYDGYLARMGRPCDTPEALGETQSSLIESMLENKNRVLGMDEQDPLYAMFEAKGGEHLRAQIVAVQTSAFPIDMASLTDDLSE